ncbi:MAG: hypothetical protein HY914_08085 [Desulfomonile tiedjei]|nr:hypothetical protein [Desulfomonile tiedjei]
MMSRRTARFIAELYMQTFRKFIRYSSSWEYELNTQHLYDFLFDNGYNAWFCNSASRSGSLENLKNFIMKLHTGESLWVPNTQNWSWDNAQRIGQTYLRKLAQDILGFWTTEGRTYRPDDQGQNRLQTLWGSLQLDGYGYSRQLLLAPETDVLETKEETGVIRTLYSELGLASKDTAFHHLELAEEHFLNSRWDDSISNSRKFLECVLQEVASVHSLRIKRVSLPEAACTRPVKIREYLKDEQLLTKKETDALAANYGLLSETGSHPYMAQNDQARLLRQISLILAQFVMLRLKGCLEKPQITVSEWSSLD